MHMVIHTPFSSNDRASKTASDKRTAQILKKFIKHGISALRADEDTDRILQMPFVQ